MIRKEHEWDGKWVVFFFLPSFSFAPIREMRIIYIIIIALNGSDKYNTHRILPGLHYDGNTSRIRTNNEKLMYGRWSWRGNEGWKVNGHGGNKSKEPMQTCWRWKALPFVDFSEISNSNYVPRVYIRMYYMCTYIRQSEIFENDLQTR